MIPLSERATSITTRPKELSVIRVAYSNMRSNAKRRRIPVRIDVWDFYYLATKPCHYCGALPDPKPAKRRGRYIGMSGLDRVDPRRGYSTANCVPCCWQCNRAKGTMSYDNFIAYRDRMAAYRGGI